MNLNDALKYGKFANPLAALHSAIEKGGTAKSGAMPFLADHYASEFGPTTGSIVKSGTHLMHNVGAENQNEYTGEITDTPTASVMPFPDKRGDFRYTVALRHRSRSSPDTAHSWSKIFYGEEGRKAISDLQEEGVQVKGESISPEQEAHLNEIGISNSDDEYKGY
jgi:hypothetical protein